MPTEPLATPPTVLVLASGRGVRFAASGGTVHTLQGMLGHSTVLERTLDAVRGSKHLAAGGGRARSGGAGGAGPARPPGRVFRGVPRRPAEIARRSRRSRRHPF